MTISKQLEKELYDFIVGSNLEYAFVKQLDDKSLEKEAKKWLQI